jgi:hypothetical protein
MSNTRFEGWDNPGVQALLRAAQEAYPHIRFRQAVPMVLRAKHLKAQARLPHALAEALRRKSRKERRHDRD